MSLEISLKFMGRSDFAIWKKSTNATSGKFYNKIIQATHTLEPEDMHTSISRVHYVFRYQLLTSDNTQSYPSQQQEDALGNPSPPVARGNTARTAQRRMDCRWWW